jgi:hypothetical protein
MRIFLIIIWAVKTTERQQQYSPAGEEKAGSLIKTGCPFKLFG